MGSLGEKKIHRACGGGGKRAADRGRRKKEKKPLQYTSQIHSLMALTVDPKKEKRNTTASEKLRVNRKESNSESTAGESLGGYGVVGGSVREKRGGGAKSEGQPGRWEETGKYGPVRTAEK